LICQGCRWNGARCPELVAGSGKHVVVVVMSTDVHGNLPMMGHVTRRAAHPITPDERAGVYNRVGLLSRDGRDQ